METHLPDNPSIPCLKQRILWDNGLTSRPISSQCSLQFCA